MKISLINLDYSESKDDPVIKRKFTPIDLANFAAILKNNGFTPSIIDACALDLKLTKILELIKDSKYLIISTGQMDRWQCPNLEIDNFYRLCNLIKQKYPEKLIIATGPHTVFNSKKLIKFSDIIIKGEPEQKLFHLFPDKIKSFLKTPGIIYKSKDKVIENKDTLKLSMEKLPLPLIEILPYKKYSYFVIGKPTILLETSRGCYANCIFCFKQMFGQGIRFKSIPQVMNELRYIKSLGINKIKFIDLDFTANKKRTIDLCKEIIKEKLNLTWSADSRLTDIDEELLKYCKAAGCFLLTFGIESLSQTVHDSMNKNINLKEIKQTLKLVKKYKINTLAYFRLGHLNETKQDILNTIKAAKKLPLDFISSEVLIPYPTTPFYEKIKQDITKISKDNIPTAYEKNISNKELNKLSKKLYFSFYFRPTYIINHIHFLFKPKLLKGAIEVLTS